MIKAVNDKETIMVSFLNKNKETVTGKLLVYEIAGEACVLVGQEKVWLPFSRLSTDSRKIVLDTATENFKISDGQMDIKQLAAVTLFVLVVFSFYYMRFGG